MLFVELKKNAKEIDLKVLGGGKASKLMGKYKRYDFEFLGFSLGDIR